MGLGNVRFGGRGKKIKEKNMKIKSQVVKVETKVSKNTGKDYFQVTYLVNGSPFRSIANSEVALKVNSLGEFELSFEIVPDKFLSPVLRLVGAE